MESYSDLIKRYSSAASGNNGDEAVIIICKKSKQPFETSQYGQESSLKLSIEELALKPTKFYKEKIGLSP